MTATVVMTSAALIKKFFFTAALKLLWFAIGIETVRCENEAQIALHAALLPLLRLGHVLATSPFPYHPYLSLPLFVASLGILFGSPLLLLFAPLALCSPLSLLALYFSIYFLPLLPPFSSASPLLHPYCLSRCLPKVARPNVAAPFVAITQSGRLPPCRTPLAWCRL